MSRTNVTLTDRDRDNIRRIRDETGASSDREAISRALAEMDLRFRKLKLKQCLEGLESAIEGLAGLAENDEAASEAFDQINAVWSDLQEFENSLL